MSNVQAAIGLAQVERIETLIARKREIMQAYRTGLVRHQGVLLNPEPLWTENGSWMPTVVFSRESGINTDAAQKAFRDADIDARVFFNPLSSLPMFSPVAESINSIDIASRAINLPSYHDIEPADLGRVISVIDRLL